MKTFEVSNRKTKDGRRKFKLILHEIYPDDCIDLTQECGTIYNENGITWIEEYCKNNIATVKDMSLRVEFVDDEERIAILGHGETGVEDGLPLFKNASVVGHFTEGSIEKIVDDDGTEKLVAVGSGLLDEMCYPDFVHSLIEKLNNDNTVYGSVEILRNGDNDGIVYKYGYKENGRIPTEYSYSGYALLGVKPADSTAKLLEINNKGENKMTEAEINALIEKVVAEALKCKDKEFEACKAECDQKIADAEAKVAEAEAKVVEANEKNDVVVSEKNELVASSEAIQAALDSIKADYEELDKKYNTLWEEKRVLEKALAEAKARERIGEMNKAIEKFTDAEREYAKDEIAKFNENPVESEINSVVNAILIGIGKNAKAKQDVVAEQNSAKECDVDIFGEIEDGSHKEDDNIF